MFEELIQRRKATFAANPAELLLWPSRCSSRPLSDPACTLDRGGGRRARVTGIARTGTTRRTVRFSHVRPGRMPDRQQKYADAEPLLHESYEGLKTLAAENPALANSLTRAIESLVQLYEAWGKPEEAAKWRQQLEAQSREGGGGRRPERRRSEVRWFECGPNSQVFHVYITCRAQEKENQIMCQNWYRLRVGLMTLVALSVALVLSRPWPTRARLLRHPRVL